MTLPFLKSPIGEQPVIVEGAFRASPERAFLAWTTPEEMIKWFGPGPERIEDMQIDLRIGGCWCLTYKSKEGVQDKLFGSYLKIETNRHLAFSWAHERRFEDGRVETTPISEVNIHFEATDTGVFIKLIHSAIQTQDGRLGVGRGWNASFEHLDQWFATTKETAS